MQFQVLQQQRDEFVPVFVASSMIEAQKHAAFIWRLNKPILIQAIPLINEQEIQ